jgi:hypothetical protein
MTLSVLIGNYQDVEKIVKALVAPLTEELLTVALTTHTIKEKLPKVTEVFVTPSQYNKSKHKETFMDLIDMLGFGRETILNRVVDFAPNNTLDNVGQLDFSFKWEDQDEDASYEPLLKHLQERNIHAVRVDLGQGLPDRLLYFEYLWTLKKNTSLRSSDLRKIGEESVFKYTLAGRTDIVVKSDSTLPLGKFNNRYFIEIKRAKDFVEEEALREAVLQLIGGNASNSFHSPPVLLTNLSKKHYVLFISLVGDPTVELKFRLNVLRMSSFGLALAFVEHRTLKMKSETLHLGRRPTPESSPLKPSATEELSSEADITERFETVTLEEAVDEKV